MFSHNTSPRATAHCLEEEKPSIIQASCHHRRHVWSPLVTSAREMDFTLSASRLVVCDSLVPCALRHTARLYNKASMPTTVRSLLPDLSVLLTLSSMPEPSWTFCSLDLVMGCPIYGPSSRLTAGPLPLSPAPNLALRPWQLSMRISPRRLLLAQLVSPAPRKSAFVPLPGEQGHRQVPGSVSPRAECQMVSAGRKGRDNLSGRRSREGCSDLGRERARILLFQAGAREALVMTC